LASSCGFGYLREHLGRQQAEDCGRDEEFLHYVFLIVQLTGQLNAFVADLLYKGLLH
jgi:hypothetical protein